MIYNKNIIKLINNIQIDNQLLNNIENVVKSKPFGAYLDGFTIIINYSNTINAQYIFAFILNKLKFYIAIIAAPFINTSQHSVFNYLYNLSFTFY